ncbi:Gfo/Idh/MocA family oxidoreductase [Marinomonas sp. IMCC 4694]|uniref:Gfo/Idh/MocA family oxidoreductase n=1 Tax=Marinomonas sp. IMCC 4694 TaxID=2605432 RepID=UPI0011E6CB87|nr:Gfo/Idh/MocA family oxidoreductase [Marinomonas sp. IMCC 4694]TYL48748.1 dehydrogenase [Marinomonas sp. IMCC 4694]
MTKKTANLVLVGAGRMGSHHAQNIAFTLNNAHLFGIFDQYLPGAKALGEKLGCDFITDKIEDIANHPEVDGVVIAAPARFHASISKYFLEHGKAVFCEKPAGLTLAEIEETSAAADTAKRPYQIGFNRRWDRAFVSAKEKIQQGVIGTPQQLRSLTRDPGPWGGDPFNIPTWTIFYETLIHDFDTLLWLNDNAKVVEVRALADALVRPDAKSHGHLDVATVTLRFDNGAIAIAEANFCAMYGYDVRAEVLGSLGMVQMGDVRKPNMTSYNKDGAQDDTWRVDSDIFVDAYAAQIRAFANAILTGQQTGPNGRDAHRALAISLACIESVTTGNAITTNI